jgi:hypothetical protein
MIFKEAQHYTKFSDFEEAIQKIKEFKRRCIFWGDLKKEKFNKTNTIIAFLTINIQNIIYKIPVVARFSIGRRPEEGRVLPYHKPYIEVFLDNIQDVRIVMIHEISHLYEYLMKYTNTQKPGMRKEKSYFTKDYRNKLQNVRMPAEQKEDLMSYIDYLSKPTEVRARLDEALSDPIIEKDYNKLINQGNTPALAIQKALYNLLGDDYKYMPAKARAKLHTELYKKLFQTGRRTNS